VVLFDGEPVRRETPLDVEFPVVPFVLVLMVVAVVTDVLALDWGLLEFRIGL